MADLDTNKYQATLNLPQTAFAMRAGLPQQEPKRLQRWQDLNLYERILAARAAAPLFVLHDGPPYANNRIHTGTAMNKILKDMVVKYKSMTGWRAPYVPGWDCHGLPIENALLKELKKTKHDVDQGEFRGKARAYAAKYLDLQREQFKRLGVLGDWQHPYVTMEYGYEADIIRAFGELYEKGYIYKGLKPIHWCMQCETALALSEIEYGEHTSPSIYVKFPVADGQALALGACVKPQVVIWTTTPWTLPANRAVTVKADVRYCAVPYAGETLILALELVPALFAALQQPAPAPLATCLGKELEGLRLQHPIDAGRTVPVILGDFVTTDTGTGCVHTAPGHGQEDYQAGLKYKLEVVSPVDDKGRFTADAPQYQGQHVFKANALIMADLQARGILFDGGTLGHSYPHCWRCHKPVIFRATEQWFLGLDRHALRARARAAIDATTWVPETGRHRIASMVDNAPDWCLSRQRLWGVPIPAVYCTACGHEFVGRAMIEQVAALIEREGSDAWFAKPVAELVPAGCACPACGARTFRKEQDILDVWFDSGVSHKAVLTRRAELRWPADVYLEGSDQHRGWFQVSLLAGVALCDAAPYKTVVTHGWTLTESGEKESKSKGNFTDPEWVCNEMGADILRLWVSSVNYMQDVMISPNLLRQMGDAYRRMRNTFKYLLGNLFDFEPGRDSVPHAQLRPLDRYMLHRLEALRAEVMQAYEQFEFYRVFHLLHNFCAVDLSARYCDILKDTLYVEAPRGLARRSAQTVLWQTTTALTTMAAPIMAFTCDEVWEHLAARAAENGAQPLPSVHLAQMPAARPEHGEAVLAEHYELLWRVRDDVLRELEALRTRGAIGAGLDADVELATDDAAVMAVLRAHEAQLHELCIVSHVRVRTVPDAGAWLPGVSVPTLRVRVQPARGTKCARCWNYSETVGVQGQADDLCERCAGVLQAAAQP